jgi:pimeloyl-ACP methyl ester carboxylesterase
VALGAGERSQTSIATIRQGRGPELLLVHGGASPAATWHGLAPLGSRWTLSHVYRRGFPPSPPPAGGRQDFEVDAEDICELLTSRPHIVAHSYGAHGALIAAIRHPERVRSITLLEPALTYLVRDDPDVARLEQMAGTVLRDGERADPVVLRSFLRIAGAPDITDGSLPSAVMRGIRRAHGSRSPTEASLSLGVLRDARMPALVASGGHHPALERVCDAAARELNADRVVAVGAGHFVANAPGFDARLERFLGSVP